MKRAPACPEDIDCIVDDRRQSRGKYRTKKGIVRGEITPMDHYLLVARWINLHAGI